MKEDEARSECDSMQDTMRIGRALNLPNPGAKFQIRGLDASFTGENA